MSIADSEIAGILAAYLDRHPEETALLAEPVELLARGKDFASRRNFDMHVTVGALLTRGEDILLVGHRAYGIPLQPGGHLEPTDTTLMGAAVRELVEETGIDPATVIAVSQEPVYIEYGRVPARSQKDEPEHFHLDLGYAFTTTGDIGSLQESEVTSAAWFPLNEATRLVGARVRRASDARVRIA
ncbi:NUDIX domain-containing protein [Actinoplanes sp. NBRC 103695]|uniref:NUDIX hydrolase n=1 Tax=Actinoplanes sp. NBRC 103695 TaxID=3032202 RepID=UPI0025556F35|nr:NUDIX domain-containing protein [Actinoplanes sp. NBRC 103695]